VQLNVYDLPGAEESNNVSLSFERHHSLMNIVSSAKALLNCEIVTIAVVVCEWSWILSLRGRD
jgi:hypothetical protein